MKPSTQDKIEGTAKEVAGAVKQETGKLIGNEHLQQKGQDQKLEGQVQKKIGEIEKVLGA